MLTCGNTVALRLALACLAAAQIAGCGSGGDEGPNTIATAASPPAAAATVAPAPAAATTPVAPPPTAATTPVAPPPPAATATATTPPKPPVPQPRAFRFEAQPLPAAVRQRVRGSSWHEGCPVALDDLRYVEMDHWGFDSDVHRGVMIVNRTAVSAVRAAFGELFDERFPIRRMHLVDEYGADDFASIEADNTSSFNCRQATGSTRWSEHAYGRAVDVNPIENPYVYADGTTTHPASRAYLDRSQRSRGMAREGGVLVAAFDAAGWEWGGRWSPAVDLQHFSANGR